MVSELINETREAASPAAVPVARPVGTVIPRPSDATTSPLMMTDSRRSAVVDLMFVFAMVIGVMVGDTAGGMDKTGRWRFKNLRSQLWWQMREALDPDNNTGIALPPDARVKADLTAPKWKPIGPLIQVEPSEDLKKRIGRSPDYGVAYVLALIDTPKKERIMGIAGNRKREEWDPYKMM